MNIIDEYLGKCVEKNVNAVHALYYTDADVLSLCQVCQHN